MALNGIDIASWQAGLNAGTIPADFVIVKATGGVSYVNPYCDGHMQQAMEAGKLVGVYHYAQEKSLAGTAVQEADHFIKNIQGYLGKSLLVLDWEEDVKDVGWAKTFLDRVYQQTGIKPLIYMSKSVTRDYDWSSVVAGDYGLWVAQYANDTVTGYQDDPWTDGGGLGKFKSAAMFQYSSAGRLPGWNKNLDLNKFYGDRNTWIAYTVKNGSSGGSSGVASNNSPYPDSGGNDKEIRIVGLARDTQVSWIPLIQKDISGIMLSYRLRGENNDRIVIEGIPEIYVDQVYNILRTTKYKIPANQLDSDKNNGRIIINGLAKDTQVSWVPSLQNDLAGYLLANDINGNIASTIEIKNIPNNSNVIKNILFKKYKIPADQIK